MKRRQVRYYTEEGLGGETVCDGGEWRSTVGGRVGEGSCVVEMNGGRRGGARVVYGKVCM